MGVQNVCKKIELRVNMKFVYSEWKAFCEELTSLGIQSVTASSILLKAQEEKMMATERFVNLKHDVESQPRKALDLARIEHKYGHCATYYVQAYLMTTENQPIFQEIQDLGHEVTYHHDVMDGAKGVLKDALSIYRENVARFNALGFNVHTVCQHGNPVSDLDNRDFFRNELIQNEFPNQSDIMVDFTEKIGKKYVYISDVGMSFKIVTDPRNLDNVPESEKYIVLGHLDNVVKELQLNPKNSYIISAHPHRYNKNLFKSTIRRIVFTTIKSVAKVLFLIPGLKKFLFRFNSITKHL